MAGSKKTIASCIATGVACFALGYFSHRVPPPVVHDSYPYFEGSLNANRNLIDLDRDGDIDTIISEGSFSKVYSIAPDMVERAFDFYRLDREFINDAPLMSSDVQDWTTKISYYQELVSRGLKNPGSVSKTLFAERN